jgi:2-polyprenyl-3-methyl-5-hydroxy-6-metoxy-1,4-benzoquinol methylase
MFVNLQGRTLPTDDRSTPLHSAGLSLWKVYRVLLKDDLQQILKSELKDSSAVLDIGAGKLPYSDSIPRDVQVYVALDLHRPYLAIVKERFGNIHRMLADAAHLPFRAGSFDAVICLNVLEHLDKTAGKKLIDSMKKLTSDKILLQTPNGFLPQSEYDEDKYQAHRSGWTVEEVSRMGFHVIGIRGLKFLRAGRGNPRLRPFPLGILVSDLSRRFVIRHPEKAFSLFCVFSKSEKGE